MKAVMFGKISFKKYILKGDKRERERERERERVTI